MSAAQLSDRDQAILEFERLTWSYLGAKEAAIREQFGMSFVRYAQVLSRLVDQPAAMAYDAVTVKRLQRLRDRRRSARTA